MSFWSKLGKGLAIGGAGLGTILTAGAASPALAGALGMTAGTAAAGGAAASAGGGLLGKLAGGAKKAGSIINGISGVAGPAASGVATGMAAGRAAENKAAGDKADFQLQERGQFENGLESRAGIDLKQRQFGQDSQNNAYKNAIRSALAKNLKDVSVKAPEGIPLVEFGGGLRPSAIGEEGRQAAGVMNQQALASLMGGEQFDALPALERTAAPEFKTPGVMENVLGGVGMGMSALNGAKAATEQKDFQQKILDAIAQISGPQGTGGVSVNRPSMGNGGVAPFTIPPKGKLLPLEAGDESNR